jgi:hypothetical protein
VVSRRLGEQLVLVNLTDNSIFELNRTGARVWELLQETSAPDELVARLGDEFDVDEARLKGEVQSLLEAFSSRGLVTGSPPGSG